MYKFLGINTVFLEDNCLRYDGKLCIEFDDEKEELIIPQGLSLLNSYYVVDTDNNKIKSIPVEEFFDEINKALERNGYDFHTLYKMFREKIDCQILDDEFGFFKFVYSKGVPADAYGLGNNFEGIIIGSRYAFEDSMKYVLIGSDWYMSNSYINNTSIKIKDDYTVGIDIKLDDIDSYYRFLLDTGTSNVICIEKCDDFELKCLKDLQIDDTKYIDYLGKSDSPFKHILVDFIGKVKYVKLQTLLKEG